MSSQSQNSGRCGTPLVNSVMELFAEGQKLTIDQVQEELEVSLDDAKGYINSLLNIGALMTEKRTDGTILIYDKYSLDQKTTNSL